MEHFKEIWQIDRKAELRNRTWWWWWWLYVFKNPDGLEKQLMCLWGTRNCKKVWVDDYEWRRSSNPVDDEKGLGYEGVAAAWYYDGKKMHDPLLIDSGSGRIEGGDNNGKVTLQGKDGEYVFLGKKGGEKFDIDLKNKNGVQINVSTRPYDPHQSSIVPTGKKYVGKLAYQMYKVKRADCSGRINIGGKTDEVEGSAYFQNVRINSPTSPWYWAFLHGENGYYLDYFVPHWGLPMMRRGYGHKSWLDRGWRKLSRGMHIYDPKEQQSYTMKKFRVEKKYVNDLPVFHLHGEDGSKKVDLELTTYSRACWKIRQPWLGISSTILHYNEYPCHITRLDYRDGGKRINLEDFGHTVGNCEHAWGIV
ncbi:MAG: hypothetical protein QCI38_02005 [Candidatus Thermoplasmatota archaeon]|nr:hypothetical protein [Candidatus Thermoplasmatota archaeon]